MAWAALGGTELWADLSAHLAQNSGLAQQLTALSRTVCNTNGVINDHDSSSADMFVKSIDKQSECTDIVKTLECNGQDSVWTTGAIQKTVNSDQLYFSIIMFWPGLAQKPWLWLGLLQLWLFWDLGQVKALTPGLALAWLGPSCCF